MDPVDPDDFFDIDKYLDSCGTTTIRQSIGNPMFRPLAEIQPRELEEEVERILDLLFDNLIEVDLCGCDPAEAYRFLTTELMAEAIEDPRAPGWTSCFIYADYHPGPEEEGSDL